MPKGGARPNTGGHRPGSGRKTTSMNALRDKAMKAIDWTGETPAEFLQRIMQTTDDPLISLTMRVDAAKAALPYIHQRQPEAHETTIIAPEGISIITPFGKALADGLS